jgi:succinyl-CoA synthetase alpha subunit
MSILLDENTRVMVQGMTSRQAQRHVPFMLEYGTRIVAGVSPGRGGSESLGVPVFDSVATALDRVGPIDLSVLFVPAPLALGAALESLGNRIPTTVVLAEGVPFRDSMLIAKAAATRGLRVVGPNCQGMISPGRAKVGASGGRTPARMFSRGHVGVISRSGGMGAETCWLLTRCGIGQSTYVSIGGEVITGSSFADIAALFEDDPDTHVIVCFGEPGTDQEEKLAQQIESGQLTKPVVAYITGSFVEQQGAGKSYGHAGAVMTESSGTPSIKRMRLREAGVTVADRWAAIPEHVNRILAVRGVKTKLD